MALAESIEYDKIEVVGTHKAVQVRKKNVIKKDGVQIASSFERYVLHCGGIDDSNNFVDTDLSAEPEDVTLVCNAVWTQAVKDLYKAALIAAKSST
tara:strand:- start:374 stop:661 length:288 start_codon:yes stop_codon:yes gene_type:complete